jgi:HD-GYP domain-containing protein (c-di-GMP phosphodiesterase class II)
MFTLHAGPATARAQLTKRSGTHLDPDLVGAFDLALVDDIGVVDAYDAVQEAEPDPVQLVDDTRLAEVARTFGDLADLKSPSLHGHSSSVGDLAHDAAERLRLEAPSSVRVAGYLHDLGRVAVSSAVWDKRGNLTTSERDQVELHPYYTERILARVPVLADVAALAGRHHERCDGSGYHRGLGAVSLPMSARVLAAADRYRSLVEARPHRPAQPAATAAATLRADSREGRLDGDAVEAVLAAAGHRTGVRRPRVADLTDRQVDVLRLLAAGLSNREIAERLVISPRTAERHVQDVYVKIGLSTRAGAALYAMEHGLVGGTG